MYNKKKKPIKYSKVVGNYNRQKDPESVKEEKIIHNKYILDKIEEIKNKRDEYILKRIEDGQDYYTAEYMVDNNLFFIISKLEQELYDIN